MDISIQEIREKLIPELCWWKLGLNHCDNPQCKQAWKDLQKWLDELAGKENDYNRLLKET